MFAAVTRVRHRVAASLGLAPGIAAGLAIGFGLLLPRIDARLQAKDEAWYLFGGGPESARELLSTISASIITLTALVFSITVLVLQLASNQYSPRIIGNFLRERTTKIALATFVGTFVFSMVVLVHVRNQPTDHVPNVSVWSAFLMLMLSILVFIRYIDRMTHSVRAITIINRVGAETREILCKLHPDEAQVDEPLAWPPAPQPNGVVEQGHQPGVLAAVDISRLVEVARGARGTLELVPKVGEFVPSGAPLLRFWGEQPLDEERARGALSIEAERTVEQDPAFGFRQLVDIAVRALSPGVNDPTTAVQAVDQLHDLIRSLTTRCFPSQSRADDGYLRVVIRTPSYEEYVRLAFEEIASYAAESVQVKRRLRLAFADCISVASAERRAVLEAQRDRLSLD